MTGFFSTEKIQTFNTDHRTLLQDCDTCGLHRFCRTPRMRVTGNGEMGILVVGDYPSLDDDGIGMQFVDSAGKQLTSVMRKYGIDLNRDCWKTNALQCSPQDKFHNMVEPTDNQVFICNRYIVDTVKKLRPKFIWILGTIAVKSFFGKDFNADMNLWRGLCVPDPDYNAWLLPMSEPQALIKNEKDPNFISQYERDIKNASICTNKKAPVFDDIKSRVKIVGDYDEIRQRLEYFNNKTMFFDYETTGIKPYREGHRIVSVAYSTPTETVSFPFDKGVWTLSEFEIIKNLWCRNLSNPNIEKIAHNLKYEEEWSNIILGTPVSNWKWCTMTNAHILDNRRGYTSLNFQAYCNFGIRPYDQYIDSYKKEQPNGLNRMYYADTTKLLTYGGFDGAIGQMLYDRQKMEFLRKSERINYARQFFHEGLLCLSEIGLNGFPINEEYYAKTATVLSHTIDRTVKDIEADDLYKKFTKKMYRPPDIQSSKDLNVIIYDYLKTAETRTEKNNLVSDKNVLEKINHPFTKNILKYREYKKISDFVASMLKLSYGGMIHGTIDLNQAISFRSNAHDPNLQNVNVRNEIAKRFCRSGFIAYELFRLLESDFSGIEVAIGAAYHQDPTMINYLIDPDSDMHRDCACDIWQIKPEEVSKMIRFYAKNCWTFPQFYGDWYRSCAEALWANCINLKTNSGLTLLEHLIQNTNIRNFEDFVEHCKEVERIFWQERFQVYDQWKKDINEFYRRHGYIETFLGFRYTGVISRKDASNYIIQGTAFHMLLWTLIQVMKEIKRREMVSKTIYQIHDSQLHHTPDDEWEKIIEIIDFYGTIEIRKQFEWINVPLKIEHELTGLGGVWTDKEPIIKKNGIWYFDRKTGIVPVRG
jgi:uracil-DNA glycosylase family 4